MSGSAYHVEPPEEGVSPRPSFDSASGSGCAAAERAASEHSYRVGRDGGPSFFYDINVSDRVATFRKLRASSRNPDIAQQLMRSDTLGSYFDNLFIKDGNGGASTPWHEDARVR